MITIKQRQDKWRLSIIDEEWELDNLNDLKKVLDDLLKLKNMYGKLRGINESC